LRLNFEAQVGKRTSTDSNFAIHKEKEMNFRRWITALAVLALFAGFASAQILNSNASAGPFQCNASVAVPPVLRAEGLTELVGDIVLTCQGGTVVAPGTNLNTNTANVTVSFGTNVTSRLLTTSFTTNTNPLEAANTNEALLLIDEPGSLDPVIAGGFGPAAPQVLCGSANSLPNSSIGAGVGSTNCPEFVEISNGVNVMTNGTTAPYTAGANVFSGVWGGSSAPNQVTFFGIPIMPPTSAGSERVYRITNIRINANGLSGGTLAGTNQVYAYISISGPTSVPLNTPNLIAGSIQAGLSTSVRKPDNSGGLSAPNNVNQCNNTSGTPGATLSVLRFSENFGSAFKLRTANGVVPGVQNVPGTIYNSESGFITTLIGNLNYNGEVGLADYGTRLKAVFSGLPSNVQVFVSTTNVINGTLLPVTATPPTTTSYAQLVLSDTTSDGTGYLPAVPITGQYGSGTASSPFIPYAQLVNVNGTASATWEVTGTNSATNENFDFVVWYAYTANVANNQPALGPATVGLSFAPNTNSGVFSATSGATASSQYTIPRFADTSSSNTVFTIIPCTTSLLFPFITNQVGFDTGMAIMNTSTDPFGTKPQSGICQLNFYGQNAPAMYPTAIIPSGNSWTPAVGAWMASTIAPNFEGYMIAVCNFQMAHGYSFVSDLGAQKLAHGSLALVLPGGSSSRPTTSPEQLEN
jgi:hypothetical protein